MKLVDDLVGLMKRYTASGRGVHYIALGKETHRMMLAQIKREGNAKDMESFLTLPVLVIESVDLLMEVGEFENHKHAPRVGKLGDMR